MIVGIEVLDKNKRKISWKRAAFRELITKVISSYVLNAGYFWMLFDPKHRAWHDHLSGTYVYKKQEKDLLPAIIVVVLLILAHGALAYFCYQQMRILIPTIISANK